MNKFLFGALVAIVVLSSSEGFAQDRASVIDDFGDVSRWNAARDAQRLRNEYDYYRFTSSPASGRSGNGLRWEIKPKLGYADIYGDFVIDEPFEKISIWVRNAARKPILFWMKLVEEDGSDYRTEPLGAPIGGTADWQRIEFKASQYQVAQWSKDENNSLDFPLKHVVLVVNGLSAGEEYHLDFDDLEVSRPTPEKVALVKAEGPGSVNAGDTASVRLTLSAGEPLRADYALALWCLRDGKVYRRWQVQPSVPTSRWKPGEAVEMPAVALTFPRFGGGGVYEMHARLGWTRLTGMDGKEAVMQFELKARRPGPIPKAEVRPHTGVPTLFINGKPNAGMTYMTYNRQEPRYFGDFGKAGVNLATFSATSDFSFYNLAPPTWLARDVFDYSGFDKRITSILDANPDALLFPRVYVSAPPWWCKENPDEVARQADETNVKGPHFKDQPFASPASEKWRTDTAAALRRFITHVRSSPYADRVIGYHVASLHTEEWFYHNFWANPPSYWGYGKADIEGYRAWLRRRYETVKRLRRAWGDPKADFDTAGVPTMAERKSTDLSFFRDPVKSRRTIDFYLYYNDIIADTIEYFARVVKEATNRESLFGVFYGYLFELSGSPESGHLALQRLLRSPDVDFFTAPSSYCFRPLGAGCSAFMSATEAIKLHGKLWFDENDYRTHLVRQKKTDFDYVALKDVSESVEVQKRELAHVLSLGTAMWWFDMGGGWYDEAGFMKAISEMNDAATRSISFDRSSVAEIAVVVDEESMCYGEGRGRLGNLLLNRQRGQLHRMGAPFDTVFLNDLEKVRPYKLYVFLNAFKLDAAQRAMVDGVVKRDGRTALWVYAPGFVGETLSDEGVSSLTGIRIVHLNERRALKVKMADVSDEAAKGIPPGAGWGDDAPIGPVFHCDDPAAVSLGVIEGLGKTGLAVKRFPAWTSVYCAAPNLPSWLLRAVARSAGVAIYSDGEDVMYINKSFLGIHTNEAGLRTLRFPRPVSLFEVFEKKQVATDAVEVKLELPARHTALYFLGAAEAWQKARTD